jgi:hypothetical protein
MRWIAGVGSFPQVAPALLLDVDAVMLGCALDIGEGELAVGV